LGEVLWRSNTVLRPLAALPFLAFLAAVTLQPAAAKDEPRVLAG
jgi:hypothetical protein